VCFGELVDVNGRDGHFAADADALNEAAHKQPGEIAGDRASQAHD
jgi:hypothetical protein